MGTDYIPISEIAHGAISLPLLKEGPIGLLYEQVTEQVIGSAFEVHRTLGHGFLEKVYQRSMEVELVKRRLKVVREHPVQVRYRDEIVGEYFCDLFVESCVLVEIKVAKHYVPEDEGQLFNVLKATGTRVGLLINFGTSKVEFKKIHFVKMIMPSQSYWLGNPSHPSNPCQSVVKGVEVFIANNK